jgi:RNA polymerase sigma factor (sigma-70 family)
MTYPVDGLKARDSKIWDQTYEKYATRLYGSILHLVRRDRQLAEDLHQETWLAAIDGIDGFNPQRGEFSAWLFSIARNAVATHWRRTARPLDGTSGRILSGKSFLAKSSRGEIQESTQIPSPLFARIPVFHSPPTTVTGGGGIVHTRGPFR